MKSDVKLFDKKSVYQKTGTSKNQIFELYSKFLMFFVIKKYFNN